MAKMNWEKARSRDIGRSSVQARKEAIMSVKNTDAAADIAKRATKTKTTKSQVPAAPKATQFTLVKEEPLDIAKAIKAGVITLSESPITKGLFAQFKFQDFQVTPNGQWFIAQVNLISPTKNVWVKFAKKQASDKVVTIFSKSYRTTVDGKEVYKTAKFSVVNGSFLGTKEDDFQTVVKPREFDIRKAAIEVFKAFCPDHVIVQRILG